MASKPARSHCTYSRAAAPEIHRDWPNPSAMLAVQAGCQLESEEGTGWIPKTMEKAGILYCGGVAQGPDLDSHSGLPKALGTACRQRIGIAHGGHNPGDTSPDDRIGAGRLLALMRAGLEGDDQRRPSSPLTGVGQRHCFGVPITVFWMPSLAYWLTS